MDGADDFVGSVDCALEENGASAGESADGPPIAERNNPYEELEVSFFCSSKYSHPPTTNPSLFCSYYSQGYYLCGRDVPHNVSYKRISVS